MKLHPIVKEWLSEFKTDNDSYNKFYAKFFGNKKFFEKLAEAIENNLEIESICHQIYKFAHLKDSKLHCMLLDFFPVILETYLILSCTVNKNIKDPENSLFLIRTCLLSVYNLLKTKITDDPEKDSKPLFFIPTFTDGSIFHSQVGRPDLDFLNYSLTVPQPYTSISSDKQLIHGLIQIYNQFISDYSLVSLNDFCSLASRISSLNKQPRIDVSSETLNELLVGIYFIIFKEAHVEVAKRALNAIEKRANYEIMTSVMLTVNAIENSITSDPHEHPFDGSIGVKTFIKPKSETIGNENVITNANFKPEKVSEDLIHLLDINQNNNQNRITKSEIINHNNVELNDIVIQLKMAPNNNQKAGSKMKTSTKSDKNQQQNMEIRPIDCEALL